MSKISTTTMIGSLKRGKSKELARIDFILEELESKIKAIGRLPLGDTEGRRRGIDAALWNIHNVQTRVLRQLITVQGELNERDDIRKEDDNKQTVVGIRPTGAGTPNDKQGPD